jgi:hypothetical protein
LGLDLSDKSFLTKDVHYLSPEVFDELKKPEPKKEPGNDLKPIIMGSFNRKTLCIVIKENNEAQVLESTSHEFLHAYSVDCIDVFDSDIFVSCMGFEIYYLDGRLCPFNEGIISMINSELIHNYWPLRTELEFYSSKLKYRRFPYDDMVAFNYLLMSDLALKNDKDLIDIRNHLFKGHFTSEAYMDLLGLLINAYGGENMKRILYLENEPEVIYRLISDLDLAHHSFKSV